MNFADVVLDKSNNRGVYTANNSVRKQGDPYLKLQIDRKFLAAIPMKHAQEVVVVQSRRLTPIPNMPKFTLGLLNQRSKVLWVVDLGQMLELQALEKEPQNYNIAIIRVDNIPLGLAVSEVTGIMRIQQELIQSPVGAVTPGLIPYLKGCFLQPQGVVLILDPEAIVNSPVLQKSY